MKKLYKITILCLIFFIQNSFLFAQKVTVSDGAFVVTMTGPNSCSRGELITVNVEIKDVLTGSGDYGITYEVKLKEKDVFFDDKIETKRISPAMGERVQETIQFTFQPKKFEWGKKLELYVIVKRLVAGINIPGLLKSINTKNDPLIVKCVK